MEALTGLLPIIVILVLFFLLMWLPQSRAAKRRAEMLAALKAGDEVETVGRVFGRITAVNGKIVTLSVGTNNATQIRVHMEGIARLVPESELKSEPKEAA